MIAGTDFVLADFEQAWPLIRERAGKWIEPHVVDGAARPGASVCVVNTDGMLVFTLFAVDNRLRALVLLGVSTGTPGAFWRQEAAMVAIARDMGASWLAFESARRGWAKVLGPHWRRNGDLYEREL